MHMDMDMTSNYMNPIATVNANHHPVAATTTTTVGVSLTEEEEGRGGGNLSFGLSDCNNNNNNNNSDNSHILPRPLPPSMYHNDNGNDNDNNNFIQQLEQQLLMAAQAQTQIQAQTQNSYNSSLHSNPQLPQQQMQPRQQQEQQQQQGVGLGLGLGTSRDSPTTCTDTDHNAGLQIHRVPVVVPTDRDVIAGRSGRYSARCNSGSLYYYKLIDTMYSEYYQPNDPYIHHNSIERQHNSIKKSILQRRSTIVNTIIQRCKNDKIITTPVVNGPGRFIRKIDKRRNELEVMDDKAIALKIVSTVFYFYIVLFVFSFTQHNKLV